MYDCRNCLNLNEVLDKNSNIVFTAVRESPIITPPTTLMLFWKAYNIRPAHPSRKAAASEQSLQLQLQHVLGTELFQ